MPRGYSTPQPQRGLPEATATPDEGSAVEPDTQFPHAIMPALASRPEPPDIRLAPAADLAC